MYRLKKENFKNQASEAAISEQLNKNLLCAAVESITTSGISAFDVVELFSHFNTIKSSMKTLKLPTHSYEYNGMSYEYKLTNSGLCLKTRLSE